MLILSSGLGGRGAGANVFKRGGGNGGIGMVVSCERVCIAVDRCIYLFSLRFIFAYRNYYVQHDGGYDEQKRAL